MRTVLLRRGTLGVQTGVHVVVEKHRFSPVDGWVQDRIRLQVLTIQIHSTRVCAVGRQRAWNLFPYSRVPWARKGHSRRLSYKMRG